MKIEGASHDIVTTELWGRGGSGTTEVIVVGVVAKFRVTDGEEIAPSRVTKVGQVRFVDGDGLEPVVEHDVELSRHFSRL